MKILTQLLGELPKICYSSYETRLFTALWVLAYFGLFRISELVAPTKFKVNNTLQGTDVNILPNNSGLEICLGRYKTNQLGKKTVLKIPQELGKQLCPVKSLSEYLNLRPNIRGPLFCHINGDPVTRGQFAAVLGKCIKVTNLSGIFKSHSFRIGRATDLAAAGVQPWAIMKMGRWSSDAYKLYIRV